MGMYPGLKVVEDEGRPQDCLTWMGDRPTIVPANSDNNHRPASVHRLARHLLDRLVSSMPAYYSDWTLAMHLSCTVRMQRSQDVPIAPNKDTLAVLRQACKSTPRDVVDNGPELIERAVHSILDIYPKKPDLVSRKTLKQRFSLREPHVVHIIPRRLPHADQRPAFIFLRLCNLFAYLLRKHQVIRCHPTLPEQLDKIVNCGPSRFFQREVSTILGAIPSRRPTTRRYEYIQAATTLLSHELVSPENTRCSMYYAPVLLEAMRCLSECFAIRFPEDAIDEIMRYYEIMHDSHEPEVPSPVPESIPDPQKPNSRPSKPVEVKRFRFLRGNRRK